MKKLMLICTAAMLSSVCAYGENIKAVTLPAPDIKGSITLKQALANRKSSRTYADREISDQHISNILWCANGVNRPANGLRTAPSAMNKQDIKIYVIRKSGVWLYNAGKHSLEPIASGDFRSMAGTQSFAATAPLNLIFVSERGKFTQGSEEAIITMSSLDAGFCSQNVYLYCAGEGLATVLRVSVDKEALSKLLKLNAKDAVIAAQSIGYEK